jgi:hypothetical protein
VNMAFGLPLCILGNWQWRCGGGEERARIGGCNAYVDCIARAYLFLENAGVRSGGVCCGGCGGRQRHGFAMQHLQCSRLALSSRIQVCIMAVVMDTNEFSLTHCNAFTDWSVASPQTSSFRRNIQFLLYIYSLYLRFLCTYCRRKKRARSNITFFLQNYLWSAGYCV